MWSLINPRPDLRVAVRSDGDRTGFQWHILDKWSQRFIFLLSPKRFSPTVFVWNMNSGFILSWQWCCWMRRGTVPLCWQRSDRLCVFLWLSDHYHVSAGCGLWNSTCNLLQKLNQTWQVNEKLKVKINMNKKFGGLGSQPLPQSRLCLQISAVSGGLRLQSSSSEPPSACAALPIWWFKVWRSQPCSVLRGVCG